MKPTLIYCYDAWCGWCYGFSTVMNRIYHEYSSQLEFEVLSGGMILPEKPRHIRAIAPYIQTAYKTVEERSGISFGKDFLWHIFNFEESDWFPHSEKPAAALCIFKEYFPSLQVQFASALQRALNFEGRDLTDNEAYRSIIEKYDIPTEEFYDKLKDPRYQQKAYEEFEMVKHLKVTGFPTVFIQVEKSKVYLVGKGYTDFDTLSGIIQKVLQSITTSASSSSSLS